MAIEVIGIDHIYISVADLNTSEKFYDEVMTLLGFKKNSFTNDGDRHVQFYNRHFGFVLRPAHLSKHNHQPLAPGLHHFCFRVESREDVDAIAQDFQKRNIPCSLPQFYPEYAPDYYAVFFTDPDGIRLEITNLRQERKKRFENWPNVGQ